MNQTSTAPPANPGPRELEARLARALRVGTVLAGALIALGLARFLAQHPREPILSHAQALQMGSPAALIRGVGDLDGLSIAGLGVVCLILTPAARVALVLAAFVRRREWTFVVLGALVLAVLVGGLLTNI